MGRAPCCDKANVKKGPWSPDEDAKLKSYIEQHGTGGNWIALPQKIGLKRCGKSCRLRWLNYLRPNIKHGGFSEEEDNIICSLYISIGSRWSIIAAQLPGRTDNDIKNYWNTRLKKKLLGKQRKDQRQARRISGSKQETRRSASENCIISGDCNQGLYYPEKPMPLSSSNVGDDHTSIRKLLMKLSGRFSGTETMNVQSPTGLSSPIVPVPENIYNNSMNWIDSSAAINQFNQSCSSIDMPMLPGTNSFLTEPDDETYHLNAMKLESFMDCLYGTVNMVAENNGSSSSESLSWNEMGPLVYPPLLSSSYQVMQQQYLLDEPVNQTQ